MSHPAEVRYLCDYVAVPSVNPMGRQDVPAAISGEARYAELVRHGLGAIGVDAVLVGEGERLSVVGQASVVGATETILVASHLDTVPVDNMTIDPFDPAIESGRLFGRGSCDTKGGMAALMAALEKVLARGALKRNVIVVGEADEEADSVGVRDVMQHLEGTSIDWAIATEPTELAVVNAHKGTALVQVRASGRACHSSDPTRGQNAIVGLARAIASLDALGRRLAEQKVHPELGPATLSIGLVRGGHAPNVVPDRAELSMDRRLLPGETEDDVRSEIEDAFRRDGVTDVVVQRVRPGKVPLDTAREHRACVACLDALSRAGGQPRTRSVAFGTDAGLLSVRGIPSVVWGPGSIRQAHTNAEYVPIDQLSMMTHAFEQLLTGE